MKPGRRNPEAIDHATFVALLTEAFPDVPTWV
jgi:hypothetical protein